jgi:predicted PurR-regulated permease PerM
MITAMIILVHAVEAYYLNPKIVSSYMEFPVFITFLILLVSEHFMGFVGLMI